MGARAVKVGCARVFPLLSDHLDGELTGLQERQVRVHLATCAACAGEADRLREVRGLLRSMPCRRLPDQVRRALRDGAAGACPPARTRAAGTPGPRAPSRAAAGRATLSRAVVLTAVALGLVSGAAFGLGGQPPPGARTVYVPLEEMVADHLVQTTSAGLVPVMADRTP